MVYQITYDKISIQHIEQNSNKFEDPTLLANKSELNKTFVDLSSFETKSRFHFKK